MSIHSITNSTCITCILKGHIHWVMHASLNSNRHFTVLPAVQRWKQYKVTNFSPWGKMCVAFISPLVISQPVQPGLWWQDAKQGGLAVLPSSYQQSPESSLVPRLVLCIEAGHTTSFFHLPHGPGSFLPELSIHIHNFSQPWVRIPHNFGQAASENISSDTRRCQVSSHPGWVHRAPVSLSVGVRFLFLACIS